MKAINCTQCGATIHNVSETSLIIDCAYCGARMMLQQDKPVTVPPRYVEPPELEMQTPVTPLKIILGVVAAVAFVPILIAFIALADKGNESTPSKAYSATSTPATYSTPSSWAVSTNVPDKPLPVVNYQPRVSWSGPNDMEHFAEPEVDISSLSHMTSEEVEKAVFKNRVVKLRVIINTEGEIDEVETISGHPILVEAATKSAKESIFSSRSKPTTRVLTYTFRVLKN
jgi:DNA-directed RNA polymerase subunit RPC12/RpoP